MFQPNHPAHKQVLSDITIARARLELSEPGEPTRMEKGWLRSLVGTNNHADEYEELLEAAARIIRRCEELKEKK